MSRLNQTNAPFLTIPWGSESARTARRYLILPEQKFFPGKKRSELAWHFRGRLPNIGGIKKLFLVLSCGALFLILNEPASSQLASAGSVEIQGVPGEYYFFASEGTFTYGSSFTYINYGTREFDSILTNLATNGTFSGQSPTTGRVVTGQV